MFHKINKFTIIAFLCLVLAGCEKAPLDEDIEGFWKLEYFETTDGQRHDCDRIFFSITRYVVEVAEKQGQYGYGSFIGRFCYKNGRTQVVMKDFKHRGNTSDNHVDATVEEMLPFGMNSTSTIFDVLSTNGQRLVLQSDYATLYLSKF